MFRQISYFVSVTATISSSTVILNLPRADPRFPVEFISSTTGERIPGFATLRFGGGGFSTSSFPVGQMPNNAERSFVPARGVSISSELSDIEFEWPIQVSNNPSEPWKPTLSIPVRIGSAFTRICQSFLITPISATEDQLVMNPQNASEYAYEGQIFYSPHVDLFRRPIAPHSSNPWSVNTAIRFLRTGSDFSNQPQLTSRDFVPCAVITDMTGETYLPHRVFNQFIRLLEPIGGVHSLPEGINIDFFSETRYRQRFQTLPTIEFVVLGENDQHIHLFALKPEQYTQPGIMWYQSRLTLKRSENENFCQFDSRFINDLLIHFDTRNNRIGFGEPLVEL